MRCCNKLLYLEISLILQLARSDVKIGPARVHGNTLIVSTYCQFPKQ